MATMMARIACSSFASTSSPFVVSTGTTSGGLEGKFALPRGKAARIQMRRAGARFSPRRNARTSLVLALTSQAAAISQRTIEEVAKEASKYFNSRRGDARNLEEALMTVPDLESIPYDLVRRERFYEIRKLKSYLVAETELPGSTGFDFFSSGQGFNTLAEYLFGGNTKNLSMEMTTPVVTQRKASSEGEKMDMTTPVITQKDSDSGPWTMAFVLPSKYTEDDVPSPNNAAVKITRVPAKTVAVTAFSGFVSDGRIKRREQRLRKELKQDRQFRVKEGAQPGVAQYNPPFTPPFARRNEVALEVE